MKRLFISVHTKIYHILLYSFCLSLLFPSSAITEPIQSVTAEVTTADVWWAGTDNAVHLVLWGTNVKDWRLNNPGNDFERGDTNTFRLTSNLPNDTCDIHGTIRIWKSPDHWYDAGGWRLAGLRVYYNDDQSNLIYQNNTINKWLEDDNCEWSDTFGTENICCFTINPVLLFAPYTGDTGYTVSVMASESSCKWKAETDDSWITITGGSSGTGDGIVTYSVANNSGVTRSGIITIAGQTHTVSQGDNTIVEQITQAPSTVKPGAPIWVKATFTNNTGNTIVAIKPDCCNTYFWVTDTLGNMVRPLDRICLPYGIPDSVTSIPAGSQFDVICDLSEMYRPEVLTSGNYDIIATYANYIKDPDYNPVTKQCSNPDRIQCYDLWTGAAGSSKTPITILGGTPVQKVTANISFDPSAWSTQWTSPPVTAYISNIEGHSVSDVDPSTIRLNGTVPLKDGSAIIQGDVLKVEFDGGQAVQSLGTAVPWTSVYPTVQGGFYSTSTEIFYGRAHVELSDITTLIQPNGGEILQSGNTWPVKWHTSKKIKPVVKTILNYTTDGTTWKSIKTLSENPEFYLWTVPKVSSSRCKVTVVLKAADGTTVGSDVSDKFFTIKPYKVKH